MDLVVEKQFSYCEGEIADMSLTAYCSSLDQCREAVARAKALEEQALAKWWEEMRVVPCGQEEQKTAPPMPEAKRRCLKWTPGREENLMIKFGEFWLNVEKVKMAVVDEHGILTVYFSKDASLKIDGNVRPDEVKRIVACLDAAAGCTPAAKTEAEGGKPLYGVASDWRKVRETLRHIPPPNEPVPPRRVDVLRYLTPEGIIQYLHLSKICPPNKPCGHIPYGQEAYPDCKQCWISWLRERDRPSDGGPHA